MRYPSRLPDPFNSRAFGTGEARASGVSVRRLRADDLVRPFRGSRIVATGLPIDLVTAYAARMPMSHYFSHITAAQIHDIPVPYRFAGDARLHVSAAFPAGRPRARGVIGYRSAPADVAHVDGLPVTSPVATWCDLSALLTLDELVEAGDSLVRRKSPLCSVAQLEAAVAERAGGRGVLRLREALDVVRPGTDSVRETRLRLLLIGAGLPEPEVNVSLYNEHGALVAICDLAWREFRVAAEYDGRHHATSSKQYNRDISRLDDVMQLDYRVVRIDKFMVDARLPAISRVEAALRSRGWRA